MKQRMMALVVVLFVLTAWTLQAVGKAGEAETKNQSSSASKASDEVAAALAERDVLLTKISDWTDQRKELERKVTEAKATEASILDRKKIIADLSAKANRTAEENNQLDDQKVELRTAEDSLRSNGTSAILAASIGELDDQIKDARTRANVQLIKITGMLSPEQQFKRETSGYYAILIGLVIMGFFVLAFTDQSIRRAIFSGEAGMQFVTLFSIIIAIILFGITQILEGKELAALLGGLSGYILGRSSSKSPNHAETEPGRKPAGTE